MATTEVEDDGHMEDYARFGRVTSSVAAAVLGHDTRSPKWAWRVITGREPYRAPNYDMERGLEHEQDAIATAEIELGVLTHPGAFIAHPELDWLGASPDAIIVEGDVRIPVEAKCPRSLHTHVPLKYFHQIQVQLECMPGAPYGIFVSWVENSEAQFVVKVERNELWKRYFLPKLEQFHQQYVVPEIEPPRVGRGLKVNGDSTWDTVEAAIKAEMAAVAVAAAEAMVGSNTTTKCAESSSATSSKGTRKTRTTKATAKSTASSTGSARGSTKTIKATSGSTST